MEEQMKAFSEIETYLDRVRELLSGLQMTEDAKIVQRIQEKYSNLITTWMENNNIPKLQFSHYRSIGVEYTIPGVTNAK